MNNIPIRKGVYRVLVDVDLTVVDSLTPWVKWFNDENQELSDQIPAEITGPARFSKITEECYRNHTGDLCVLMNERAHEAWKSKGRDPMHWWRQGDLYDNMQAIPGALAFFLELKRRLLTRFHTVEFVAVSKCEPEHERSKRRLLGREFPDLFSGFISTDDKHLVAGDMLIDDNPKYIKPCIDNSVFVVYVPQGNYEVVDLEEAEKLLYLAIEPTGNHFEVLSASMDGLVRKLFWHYDYVR